MINDKEINDLHRKIYRVLCDLAPDEMTPERLTNVSGIVLEHFLEAMPPKPVSETPELAWHPVRGPSLRIKNQMCQECGTDNVFAAAGQGHCYCADCSHSWKTE